MKTTTNQLLSGLLCLLIFLAYAVQARAQWTNVGAAGFSAGSVEYLSLKFHPTSGEPYVAYSDYVNSTKTTVMRFTSGAWANVGTAAFSAGGAEFQSLAFHPTSGEPYITYRDNANGGKTTVLRFTSGAWVNVGAVGVSAGSASFQCLVLHPTSGQPYVAYKDNTIFGRTTVKRFTTSWIDVGMPGFSGGNDSYQSLAFHPTSGELYIAYQDGVNGGKTTVMRYNGNTSWLTVGTAGFSAGVATYQSLAFHPTSGEPYVAYQDGAVGNKTTVMRFTSGAWVNVGTAGFSASGAAEQSLAFHPTSGEPYVAYRDGAVGEKTTVMQFTSGAWENVGTAGFSAGAGYYPSVAFHPTSGEPYVAYADNAIGFKTTVMRFSPPLPEINLQGNSVSITDGNASPAPTDHTDFGATGISTPFVRTFTIQNTGPGTLNITSIGNTNTTDFSVGGLTLPIAVSAGSSATFTVTLNAATMGTKTATITVNNDDADEGTYDFAITGKVIHATPGAVRGNMVSFAGTNGRINAGDINALDGVSQITLETWLYVPSGTWPTSGMIMSKQDGGNTSSFNRIEFGLSGGAEGGTNDILVVVGGSPSINANYYTNTDMIQYNVWYHVAMVFDGTLTGDANRLKLYVDGVQQSMTLVGTSVPAQTPSTNAGVLSMGTRQGGTLPFRGSLDEARVWNTARTRDQIRENMHTTLAGNESGLLAYYQFNEASGDAIEAISNNPGVLTGSVTRVASTVSVAKGAVPATRLTVPAGASTQTFGNMQIRFTGMSAPAAGDEFVISQLEETAYNNASSGVASTVGNYWTVRQFGTQTFSYDQITFTIPSNHTISAADEATPANLTLYKRPTNSGTSSWGAEIGTGSSADNTTKSIVYTLSPTQTSFSEFVPASTTSMLFPVEWLSFEATPADHAVILDWATASEQNNASFTAERSLNGVDFEAIGTVAAAGNSSSATSYTYTDAALPAARVLHYRIRQTDMDGSTSHSEIRTVALDQASGLSVYPNPATNQLTVRVPAGIYTLALADAAGHLVCATTTDGQAQTLNVDLSGLAAGMYVLRAGAEAIRVVKE